LLASYLYEVVNWSARFSEIWENFGSGKIAAGIQSIGKLILEVMTKPILALLDTLTSFVPGDFAKKINEKIKGAIYITNRFLVPKTDTAQQMSAQNTIEPIKRKTTTELIRELEFEQAAESKSNRISGGGIQAFYLSIQNLIGMNVGTLEGKDIDPARVAEILKVELLKQTAQIKGF
jgi:hypothetical protein